MCFINKLQLIPLWCFVVFGPRINLKTNCYLVDNWNIAFCVSNMILYICKQFIEINKTYFIHNLTHTTIRNTNR